MMFCFHRCVKRTINDFRLLSHGPLCGQATSVPAADMQVAWLGTHSSDVTDTYQPPCLHLPAKLTESQLDSGHCCGLCERSVLLQSPRHKEAPQPLAGRARKSHCSTMVAVTQPLSVTSERFHKIQWPGSCH